MTDSDKSKDLEAWHENIERIRRGETTTIAKPDPYHTYNAAEAEKPPQPATPETAPDPAPSAAPEAVSETIAAIRQEFIGRDALLPDEPRAVPIPQDDLHTRTPQEQKLYDLQYRNSCLLWRCRWLRARLKKAAPSQPGSEAAERLKAQIVADLEELRPKALRAAKRGKPALLRLIVRTIRTKL